MNRFSRPGPLAASTGHSPFFKLDLITRFLSGDSRVSFFFPFPSNGSIDRFLAVCSRFRTRNRSAFPRPAGWKTRKELGIAMLVCSSCPRETSFAARHWQTLKMSFRWTSIRVAPSRLLIYIIKSFEIVPLVFPEKIQLVCSMISST